MIELEVCTPSDKFLVVFHAPRLLAGLISKVAGPGDFPGSPVVTTSPSKAGVQVPSLVRELRFHMPCG